MRSAYTRSMSTTVACGDCSEPLNENPSASLPERQPCPKCGSLGRHFDVTLSETVTLDEYLVARHKRVDADRSLPEKGVVRSEAGTRVGRDGRRVHREALYDPYSDVASERVVDDETGDVIVDKVESMKKKYADRGRYAAAMDMQATCSRCGDVKAGPIPTKTASSSPGTGGTIVKAGEPPAARFICSDCLAKG
jgi:hypothetical protein